MSIIVKEVSKSFGTPPIQVLNDISLEIKDGEFIALTGRSGSGKSTLLYLISTLDHATSGKIEIDGKDLSSMKKEDIHTFRNKHMGFVFQFHYLIAELNALENVLLPTLKENTSGEQHAFAQELLDRFGLKDKWERLPSQLSGGEQQRVAIARALIMKPRYLFADEPTGSLDTANGKIVMDILKDANRIFKTTVIMVTHDANYALEAHRKISLLDGKIIHEA